MTPRFPWSRWPGLAALLAGWLLLATTAQALTPEQARALAVGESEDRIAAVQKVQADADEKTLAFLQALLDDAVRFTDTQVIVVKDGEGRDPVTGAAVKVPDNAEDVVNNNLLRSELDAALAGARLASPDRTVRADAIKTLQDAGIDEARLPLIDKALAAETDATLKAQLARLQATVLIASADVARRKAAVAMLTDSGEPAVKALLAERLADGVEPDADVRSDLRRAIDRIDARLAWGERAGVVFTGLSLGSILLLAALGLAITYGLMGVINMAHGELIMVGAYATWLVQNAFRQFLPGAFDWYVLAAIPVSFLAAAAVGAVLERGVIRFLYGRPLETLLATWGISLVLMQAVRSLFGAQNVQVENPSWLSGGVDVLANLTLPWNRVGIIVFAVLVLAAVYLMIARTRLGLFVRGVTQNRRMAACMGVNTARIDTYAFALGSGIAGLAGCALSQVGNVGPDLGQAYIVDSFMVVVLGGVGQLAGTVVAGLGLGVLNKLLEGWSGAVLAKIMVLVFIVIFIQKRPQGLFAMKGRSAEA
jgi:urea transport system permease protein